MQAQMEKIFHGEVKEARRKTMDLLQTAFGHDNRWPFIRSKILEIFGKNGLERMFEDGESDRQGTDHGSVNGGADGKHFNRERD